MPAGRAIGNRGGVIKRLVSGQARLTGVGQRGEAKCEADDSNHFFKVDLHIVNCLGQLNEPEKMTTQSDGIGDGHGKIRGDVGAK